MVEKFIKKAREKFTDPKSVLADTILRILDEEDMLKLQYRHIRNKDIERLSLIFIELYNFPMEELIEDNTGIQISPEREVDREEIDTKPITKPKSISRKVTKKT